MKVRPPAGVWWPWDLGSPQRGSGGCPDMRSHVVCGRQDNGPKDVPILVPGPVDMSDHVAKGTLQMD